MSLQAVILAGGLGTRLRPLTYKIPKSMVPILGKPYLYYQLEFLREQGITNVLLLTGYLGNQIEEYFRDGSHLGLKIKYSRELEPLGTGGALRNAEHLLEKRFFVIYGDSYLPLDYNNLENIFLESNKKGLVVIYDNQNKDTGVCSNIDIDGSLLVTRYLKGIGYGELRYVDAGILALKREVLKFIPNNKKVVSLEEDIFPILIQEKELIANVTKQRFYDIGTQEGIEKFQEFLKNDYFKNAI